VRGIANSFPQGGKGGGGVRLHKLLLAVLEPKPISELTLNPRIHSRLYSTAEFVTRS
jgi:hypothetical protein